MGIVIDLKGQTVSEGNTGFKPLPAGPYAVSIFDAEVEEYGPKTANKGRNFLKVQFRIDDGQDNANRRLFENIPLFTTWAATKKNPEGSDAFTFYAFFSAVLGKKDKEFRDEVRDAIAAGKFTVPEPNEILGKKLTVNVKIVPDSYAFNKASENGTLEDGETQADYLTNDISAYKVYSGPVAKSATAAEVGAFVL